MGIKRLEIAGFKSIDNVVLEDLPNYCVFAGANGAGKSNFFDAMKFASTVVDDGAVKAIRQFHGYERIHCVEDKIEKAKNLRFECKVGLRITSADYSLEVQQTDQNPVLKEQLTIDTSEKPEGRKAFFRRNRGRLVTQSGDKKGAVNLPKECSLAKHGLHLPTKYGAEIFPFDFSIWIGNFRVFRFDPFRAKEPDDIGADPRYLDEYGRNLSTVLEAMQKNEEDFVTVMEWASMIVPELAMIRPQRNTLDGRASLEFHEAWTKYPFPPRLVSDGTFYVLCLLVAVLTRIKGSGVTMIEEPERGIRPKAIEQLSQFFREHASEEHQIFISTHNESFVRSAKPEKLFFVSKEEGRTQFRRGRDVAESLEGMPNDKAWLQNMFNGGLPW
jgi:predicted ATPase